MHPFASDSLGPVEVRSPLLTTKLYIPAVRPNTVSRPRLLERLGGALAARLTLVSAPAGAGKSTLLSEWLRRAGCLSAWVSLDAADNDPARFFAYVMTAVDDVVPGSAEPERALLGLPDCPPLESLLTAWLNRLCALDRPLLLVLDDYHVIEAGAVHAAVGFLLDNLPPQLHLVIATRTDPPLPLAKLRARGHLLEVRGDDLRFTRSEAAVFLQQTMGLALAAEEVAALEARTEGWIAGLQMAALSMQGRDDVAAFVRAFSGSHRHIFDYLVEEVLDQQPEDVQEFLLQTCILERFTAPLCEAVTGRPGALAMLEVLERRNLFVVALDHERRWYRYHPLFADLLRSRLRQRHPELEPTLSLRAADWCERNGLIGEAMRYAVGAQDIERAARLAESQVDSAYIAGHCSLLWAEASRLPLDLTARCPRLRVHAALRCLYSQGDVGEAEALLSSAEAAAEAQAPGPEARDLLGMVAAVRACIADLQGDEAGVQRLAEQARANLAERNPLRGVVAFTLGDMAFQVGDLERAECEWRELRRLGRALGASGMVASAARALMAVEETRGRLRAALALGHEALTIAQAHPELQREVANVNIYLSHILYEQDDLQGAERALRDAMRHAEAGGSFDAAVAIHTMLARVRLAQGDLTGAAEALCEAERGVAGGPVTSDLAAECAAARVRLWLAQSRLPDGAVALLPAAERWADEWQARPGGRLVWAEELEQIAVLRVRLAQGRWQEAAGSLSSLAAQAGAGGRTGRLIEILALQALAWRAQGEPERGYAALAKALTLAEPEGYVRVFVDEGSAMARLLKEMLIKARGRQSGRHLRYVHRLLAASGARAACAGALAGPPGGEALVEPLSERELEVLRLAAEGLSNREIAARLIVTVGTVKTHLHNVYGKLGVEGRMQAVARARALNLL